MALTKVAAYSFRNLRDAGSVETAAREVFLIGENGQGKTNFIECVYLICFGSSFRTRQISRAITYDEDVASVQGTFVSSPGRSERNVRIRMHRNGAKQIELDGKSIQDRKVLLRNAPCILFSHDDMEYITGSPDRRRQFFDQTLSFYNYDYIDSLRGFRKILKARNAALKEGQADLLDVYDWQLARYGADVVHSRDQVVQRFNRAFVPLFTSVSGFSEPLEIRYRPSWPMNSSVGEIVELLRHNRRRDILLGTTSRGPHRDDFVFEIRARDFPRFASTGQIRLASLALKAAQSCFVHSLTGRKPILLLDDVLLEIDGKKKEAFIRSLPDFEQAFFTFLPEEDFAPFHSGDSVVYLVREGAFTACNARTQCSRST